MLEEPQREGRAPPFEFGDANIRDGAKAQGALLASWRQRRTDQPGRPDR
jgi:hypothetical protein